MGDRSWLPIVLTAAVTNASVERVNDPTIDIPLLGLGTWRLSGSSGTQVVLEALELGYRHIDTAQMYGNEDAVGRALAETTVPRDDIWLTTKIDDPNHRPDDMRRSFEASLAKLRVDRVDLLLIHWPVEWDTMAATLEVLAEFRADGRATHVGVSNFEVDQIAFAVDHAPIEVNQIEFHPLLDQTALLQQAKQLGIHITAYCPIARGLVADDAACAQVARRHGVTAAQVALAWVISHPGVSAIPQTSKPHRLVENLAAGQVRLDAEDVALIDATDKNNRLVSPPKSPWRRPGHERT